MGGAEFGAAIHRWRDRVAPGDVGLPAGGRRRAAGLRREELAQLAGISVDYVTRLEQGRATNPSSQVVEALTRALRLSAPERDHLYHLAGLAPPGPTTVPTFLPPSVQRLLDRLSGTPVAVHDATWTLLVSNPPYRALMGDSTTWHGRELNGVWRHFLGRGPAVRYTPEALSAFETALVADLRAAADRYPADRPLRELVAELRRGSPRFAELWAAGAVGVHDAARKTVDHPRVGPVTLDCDVLSVAGSDLRIMVYTAEPGTEDADRLALLMVVGTQQLGPQ
ncbi:helix-turn-helix transcriptional regulator [Streptacidiphilus jiangxiensis]|uniref:Helix-turn-helix domain-containing protein n=1 Tax=Streptacidiphilus jiangxiensis TaxID=235985 RepID=A0A1H7YVZ2_STRJI|nr:helix-turn-helix transcriptional regulator [Streptacidiphilus jiangxiensis]SEM50300.1 Helix-turn-helix domain-containing protein [Streptacidiphilus jiangxiensis]